MEEIEKMDDTNKASMIHKNISKKMYNYIKPGITNIEIIKEIENEIKNEVNKISGNQLNHGIAFPPGISINNCVAHYTPNYNENKYIIKNSDIIKIDYGVHINGNIIDSAFTIYFDEKYKELIEISKDITRYVIKNSGIDVILGEIGELVDEYINNTEIEIDNKIEKLTVMKDISGHKIDKYKIHAGKAVPNTKINYNERMLENEYYAIEPFVSTGSGYCIKGTPISHYSLNDKIINIKNKDEKKMIEYLLKKYKTLPFCERWLNEYYNKYDKNIFNNLIKKNIINEYPPLFDINNSIVSQFEHTIYIKNNGVIILTDNDNY